jgi:hypothetical protein
LPDDAASDRSAAERLLSDCIDQHPVFPRWTNLAIVIVTVYLAFSNKQVVRDRHANAGSLEGWVNKPF